MQCIAPDVTTIKIDSETVKSELFLECCRLQKISSSIIIFHVDCVVGYFIKRLQEHFLSSDELTAIKFAMTKSDSCSETSSVDLNYKTRPVDQGVGVW